MIIYADILIFTNTIIDYFLLTITSFIVKKSVKNLPNFALTFRFRLFIIIIDANARFVKRGTKT